MSWFIEAWQPDDGMAFVSSRRADGSIEEIDFLGPPTFDPVLIRDLATVD